MNKKNSNNKRRSKQNSSDNMTAMPQPETTNIFVATERKRRHVDSPVLQQKCHRRKRQVIEEDVRMDCEYEKRLRLSIACENQTDNSFEPKSLSHYLKRKQSDIQDDRFIPARNSNRWEFVEEEDSQQSSNEDDLIPNKRLKQEAYQNLLQNELLQQNIMYDDDSSEYFNDNHRVLAYSNVDNITNNKQQNDSPRSKSGPLLSPCSVKLLRSPRQPTRKIAKTPFKVLDAPELADDFYLNLVDWSSTNVLAVGLNTCVYLWNAASSAVTRLCDLSTVSDVVTSVAWSERGSHIAIGTTRGFVQIWDLVANKQISMISGHTARVGSLTWMDNLICSGSRDRSILFRDLRNVSSSSEPVSCLRFTGHRQEVCGLRWSPDKVLLASGGNDNNLMVWSLLNGSRPLYTFSDHVAAVKAIAWSPYQLGLLASGGGTADRCIRFWNVLTGNPMQCIDTGSQVCNLAWSQHSNELVSTHGYSQNQIVVWKCPSMQQIAKLTGHSFRVLYLACSPDGESIVTGAGDETLRFWNVFQKNKPTTKDPTSKFNLFNQIR